MKKIVMLAALAALVAGCQGTPVGDAMIGKEKLAQMDDDYCRSIGAKPGSDLYVQCRMYKTAERNQNHQAAFRRAGAGFAAAGRSMQATKPVNCTSTGYGTTVRTTCY